MPENTKIDLFGFDELNKFFETMKRTDQRRVILNSFRLGGKPLISTARRLLKTGLKKRSTGTLNKSMGFVPLRARKNSVFISAKIGARRFGNYRGYHGHLVDAGTTSRQTRQGFARGEMPANRFFTNAMNQTQSQMINESQNNILEALNKLIQRKLKQQKK